MGLNESNKIQVPIYGTNIECRQQLVGSNYLTSSEPSGEVRHRQPNEVPRIVPCYNGKSLKIHEDLVVNGLSAISIKHHKGNCKDEKRSTENGGSQKMPIKREETKENEVNENDSKELGDLGFKTFPKANTEVPDCLKDKMKRRNSFWSIHRPELSKLTWPENFVSCAVLQDFFHNHLRSHGTFCEPLHEYKNRSSVMAEEFRDYSKMREIIPPRILPPDEKVVNIMEKSRSVQLNDEDLDPETMVHKSRAEFCVTIGEYIRRAPLKRTTSQLMPKCNMQHGNRFESLPLQHEGLLSKEGLTSEERISSVIGSTGFPRRRSSVVDCQRVVRMSPTSLNDFNPQLGEQVAEDGGDPAGLRTILSPRDESAEETGSRNHRV